MIAKQIIAVALTFKSKVPTAGDSESLTEPSKKRRRKVQKQTTENILVSEQENCPINHIKTDYTDFDVVFADEDKLSIHGKIQILFT